MNLLTNGKLNNYLTNIDKQAKDMFLWLVNQMAKDESITKQFKAENQIKWVCKINNTLNRAIDIVSIELIYV